MSNLFSFLVVGWFGMTPIDQEILDYLLDEKMRQEYPLNKQIGCPFEPGDYYNMECA